MPAVQRQDAILNMKYVVALLIVLLLVLHQDYWNWSDATLWFGFLPHSLAWHMGISCAAAGVWLLATMYCWPADQVEAAPSAQGEKETIK